MNQTNERIDLNLLRVFLAIWDLRSLTAAADRLGLTQSAISHSLRRLRERFDDPLFVRSSSRMLPTEAAVRLHGPLDAAFSIINRAIQERVSFDPLTTQRTFRIAMSDVAEVYLLPRLMVELMRAAPLVRIDILPLVVDNVLGALRAGEADLAIGYIRNAQDQCVSTHLLDDRLVCMVRCSHPLADSVLDEAKFSSLRYVHAGTSAPGHQMIDQWLSDAGIRRQIAVRLGHFIVAPEVVRNTDLAVIFPESLGRHFNTENEFKLMPLPFDLPPIEVKVHSHPRFNNDLGIKWLRELIINIFAPKEAGQATSIKSP